jgi:hypothetical protein
MLPQFAQRHGSALHIERVNDQTGVIARITAARDTTCRITDLRHLAQRYNAMFDQRRPQPLRIAR